MQLIRVQLSNVRCFDSLRMDFHSPVVIVQGANGSGKTSLVEAISYLGNLRSFRTRSPRELIGWNEPECCIKATLKASDETAHEMLVSLSPSQRIVKRDGKLVTSYRDIVEHVRVVTLVHDDLQLVSGGPHERRAFIDQAITLEDPDYVSILRKQKNIVAQRHALLQSSMRDERGFYIWTQQLWQNSVAIEQARKRFLQTLVDELAQLTTQLSDIAAPITLTYDPKVALGDDFDAFWQEQGQLLAKSESQYRRNLFGAHLDDISIAYNARSARTFASRGQQKILVMLVKIAQVQLLLKRRTHAIFLLDDYMTDFDHTRIERLASMLRCSLDCQLVFTCPQERTPLHDCLQESQPQIITLANR